MLERELYKEKSSYFLSFEELLSMIVEDTLVVYTSVFDLSKSYHNFILAEINQLCYGGVLRSVALGQTDGLSTWHVPFMNLYQSVVVPIGQTTLGRIFNVAGSSIDSYIDLMSSCCFRSQLQLSFKLESFHCSKHLSLLSKVICSCVSKLSFEGRSYTHLNYKTAHYKSIGSISYYRSISCQTFQANSILLKAQHMTLFTGGYI